MHGQPFAQLADLMKDVDHRESVSEADIQHAKKYIENIADTQSLSTNITEVCEVLRYLRNTCIQCKHNQDLIVHSHLVDSFKKLVDVVFDPTLSTTHQQQHCGGGGGRDEFVKSVNRLKMLCITFLGNLVVQNTVAVRCVWRLFFPVTFFAMMSALESRGKDFLCMVLYNSLRSPNAFLLPEDGGEEFWLLVSVIEHCRDFAEVEWGLLVVELVLSSPHNFVVLYDKLRDYPTQRTSFLDILLGYLTETIPDGLHIPEENLVHLAKELETKASCLMLLANKKGSADDDVVDECQHLYKLICVLSAATGHAERFSGLRSSESLLKTSISLLIDVCKCSEPVVAGVTMNTQQAGENQQQQPSPSPSLPLQQQQQQQQQPSPPQPSPQQHQQTQQQNHPMFDVKRSLVKLIGNMCYQNRAMQEATRTHGGITPILSCCVIDDRNPFLMQWAIFAVRTVCEGNAENQKFIAGLENQGIVENLLNDTKVATRLENGKIRICSIDE